MVNFFILDRDPSKIVRYCQDVHILSMYSEIVLILDFCHKYYDGVQKFHQTPILAKKVSIVLWTAENSQNYLWVCRLVKEVMKEYRYRFPDSYSTRYDKYYEWFSEHIPINMPRSKKITPFRISHSSMFFDELTNDPITNSRYLYADLKNFSPAKNKFTRRPRPPWLIHLREKIKEEKTDMIKKLDKLDSKLIDIYLDFSYYKYNISYKKALKTLIHTKLKYYELVEKKNKYHYFAYPILIKLVKIHQLIGPVKDLIEYSKTMKQNEKLNKLYDKLIPLLK